MSTLRRPSPLAFLSLLFLAVALASCGDDSTGPGNDDQPFNGTILVLDDRFSPASVTIAAGDSVTWRWQGSHAHTVTQGTTLDPAEDPTRLFDTSARTSGTFGYRFTSAGTVPYFCRPHFPAMKGTVVVEP